MARRDYAGRNTTLNEGRQAKQTQCIRDLWSGPTDTLGKLILCTAKVLKKLAIGSSLFQGIQFRPVQVLEQSITEKIGVIDVTDDGGNRRKTRILRRTKTTFTHNKFEALRIAGFLSDDDRLQHTYLTNTVNKFAQLVFVKEGSRLPRVRVNQIDVNLAVFCIRDRIHTTALGLRVASGVGPRVGRGLVLAGTTARAHGPLRRLHISDYFICSLTD